MEDAEDTMRLIDFYWYEVELFKQQQQQEKQKTNNILGSSSSSVISETASTPNLKKNPSKTSLSESSANSASSLMDSRTMSEQSMSYASLKSSQRLDSSFSPNSVLFTPTTRKLHTIFSGKVPDNEETPEKAEKKGVFQEERLHRTTIKKSYGEKNRRRKKKGLSKSLSDLEFVELKGFMDLGFVFSEEDRKDSSLASIIPGLQRLGLKKDHSSAAADADNDIERDEEGEDQTTVEEEEEAAVSSEDEEEVDSRISRPYLSEAWEVMMKAEQRKKREEMNSSSINSSNSLFMNWRVPAAISSEVDMKDYLKCWAHSVASSVR